MHICATNSPPLQNNQSSTTTSLSASLTSCLAELCWAAHKVCEVAAHQHAAGLLRTGTDQTSAGVVTEKILCVLCVQAREDMCTCRVQGGKSTSICVAVREVCTHYSQTPGAGALLLTSMLVYQQPNPTLHTPSHLCTGLKQAAAGVPARVALGARTNLQQHTVTR